MIHFPGSADRTVKFWDLESFELIGSTRPEVSDIMYSLNWKLLSDFKHRWSSVLCWDYPEMQRHVPGLLFDPVLYASFFIMLGYGFHPTFLTKLVTPFQATGVRGITFHPDGRTLFSGLEDSLKVWIVPVVEFNEIVTRWYINIKNITSMFGNCRFTHGSL